ncbi:MAG: polysaccharide pyruvyl transferase CsaB [Cyanobacteriota bacterium]
MTRSVLLCGYYGEHNLGDDALLEALLHQLPASVTPLVTAYDQAAVEQRHGVATVQRRSLRNVLIALRQCRALVLGGGSLLQDSTSLRSLLYYGALIVAARLQGRPVFLWAQGLGPLRRLRSRLLVRWLLPMATAITWRDAGSARLARGLGCVAPHGADAVWALPPLPWLGRGGPIVVCWRPTRLLTPQSWSVLLEALSQLAEAHDRQVLWLPFHRSQDDPLLQWLQQQGLMPPALLRRSRQLEAQLPSEAMAVFRSAGLVVAMRLHALILAALSGSPVAALSYDPKVQACASEFGCGCTDLADVLPSPDQLSAAWADALGQPTSADALRQMQQATAVHQALLQRLGA